MYKVYADNKLIYSSTLENMKIFNPKYDGEVNKTGSFKFTIYPDHPYYNRLYKLKTIITVYQDDYMLFRGRILNDGMGFHNEKNIECEGDLAFLLDSIYRPYDFKGSIEDFLSSLIENHNSQVEEAHRFTLGTVTVTDPNNYIVRASVDYSKTWDIIQDKLIKLLGGYIRTRHKNGITYIDYLQDFTQIAPQKIEFAKNLLDLKRIRKGEDIATALIPLGAKLKDEEGQGTSKRLTIKSVNNGIDYIYDADAVSRYGWIFATNIWDDVTEPTNLLTKGNARLAKLANATETIELTAADMAGTGKNIESFHLGTYVKVTSNPHGIDQNFLVSKLSIELLKPASNKMSMGGIVKPFTEQSMDITVDGVAGKDGVNGKDGKDGKDAAIQSETEPANKSYMWLDTSLEPPLLKRWNGTEWESINDTSSIVDSIVMLEQNLSSSIAQSSEEILQTVSEQYYIKGETDALISSVSTELEQTKDSFEMRFNTFNANLDDVAAGTDAQFQEISKYIRFENGNIILGKSGNEITLKIQNDRILFLESNAEVAYFTNRKMYITDGEFLNSLRLGSFQFLPRDNGNLSFKKM